MDIVVFRHDGETVFALFPFIDHSNGYCTSYQHIGQHSGADYAGCIADSRPAKPEEYADLKAELESIGYELDVRKKRRPKKCHPAAI